MNVQLNKYLRHNQTGQSNKSQKSHNFMSKYFLLKGRLTSQVFSREVVVLDELIYNENMKQKYLIVMEYKVGQKLANPLQVLKMNGLQFFIYNKMNFYFVPYEQQDTKNKIAIEADASDKFEDILVQLSLRDNTVQYENCAIFYEGRRLDKNLSPLDQGVKDQAIIRYSRQGRSCCSCYIF